MQTTGQVDPNAELRNWLTAPFARATMQQQMEQAQQISDYFQPSNIMRMFDEQSYRPPPVQPERRPWLGPQQIGTVLEPGGVK